MGHKLALLSVRDFRRTVYAYFASQGRRTLPWRRTSDPYHIVVSEVMLQQTQVARVIGKYAEFIRAFPTVKALCRAPLKRVLKVWQGLGYNRRALSLKRLAEQVVSEHRGRFPRDRRALRRLAGIGEATSGAICAFAFNLPEVFIETNIRSVFIHHFFKDQDDISDTRLLPLVEKTLDRQNPRRWYSALMDYGVHLKSSVPNPSRKSSHYVRQSRFEGSDRQVRAKIVRLLLKQPMGLRDLHKATATGEKRLEMIVSALLRDRLIRRAGDALAIAH